MKTKYLIPIIFLAFSSCSKDFLEQNDPNAVAVGQYFKTENDVALALNGAYRVLREGDAIGDLYNEERSDNRGTNDNQSNAGEPFQFNDFSILPGNSYLKSHWSALYKGVNNCNVLLSHIDEVKFNDEALKERYKAEAKFLRAYLYFCLVRKWGDVPLSTKELSSKSAAEEVAFREKKEVVYGQIVQDLKDGLTSNLANTQWEYAVGRVSKVAINALLGQVYLTMGATLSADNQANMNAAEQYLTAAYNMKTFGKLTEIPYTDVFDVSKKNTCKELILQVGYIQGDQNYRSNKAADYQARGETINSLKPSTGAGANVKTDLVKDYESGDVRKDFSVHFAANTQVNDWYVTKYRDKSEAAGVLGWGGNDEILMRYADVMLMLAETKMRLNKNAEAISLLNEVRERAALPDYETSMRNSAYATKYPTLKEAILHERRVELAFENHRWYDLIRNFTATELVDYFKKKDQADYGLARIANITTKDFYYPIPFDEYKLNPEKMYQNPGY